MLESKDSCVLDGATPKIPCHPLVLPPFSSGSAGHESVFSVCVQTGVKIDDSLAKD